MNEATPPIDSTEQFPAPLESWQLRDVRTLADLTRPELIEHRLGDIEQEYGERGRVTLQLWMNQLGIPADSAPTSYILEQMDKLRSYPPASTLPESHRYSQLASNFLQGYRRMLREGDPSSIHNDRSGQASQNFDNAVIPAGESYGYEEVRIGREASNEVGIYTVYNLWHDGSDGRGNELLIGLDDRSHLAALDGSQHAQVTTLPHYDLTVWDRVTAEGSH